MRCIQLCDINTTDFMMHIMKRCYSSHSLMLSNIEFTQFILMFLFRLSPHVSFFIYTVHCQILFFYLANVSGILFLITLHNSHFNCYLLIGCWHTQFNFCLVNCWALRLCSVSIRELLCDTVVSFWFKIIIDNKQYENRWSVHLE